MFKHLALLFGLATAACAPLPLAGVPTAAQIGALPKASGETAMFRNAMIEPSGFATILDAPPATFTPSPPPLPVPPRTAEQVRDSGEFGRVARFQNEVFPAVSALQRKLRRSEPANFVDLYYENEGEPHVVFRFLRDPQRTLAKYTKGPRFRAAKADYTEAELQAALEFMMTTFRDDRVIMGGGTGNKDNRAVIDLLVPEAEFRAIAASKGVTIPPTVKLVYHARGPTIINQPLPPHLARFIRVFPRDDRPLGILNSINSTAKVVLQDGCFRASDQGNALVLLPLGASLFIDREGYLAFGSQDTPGYARVGEEVIFPGSIGEVTAPELVDPIHAACGPGKVIKVNALQSAAAERAQGALSDNANALRQLRESYGLSLKAAQVALDRCKAQTGRGVCLLTPPPPVARQTDCPAGTKLSFGLCRTPEGYIRPAPKWIADLIGT